MIVNDLGEALNMCIYDSLSLNNDLLQCLGGPNMCLIKIQWSSMIFYKASVAQICVFFRLYESKEDPNLS